MYKIHLAVNTISWIALAFSSVCTRLVYCHCASSSAFFANYLCKECSHTL